MRKWVYMRVCLAHVLCALSFSHTNTYLELSSFGFREISTFEAKQIMSFTSRFWLYFCLCFYYGTVSALPSASAPSAAAAVPTTSTGTTKCQLSSSPYNTQVPPPPFYFSGSTTEETNSSSSSASAYTPYRLSDTFVNSHIVFLHVDFNTDLPRAAWATYCRDKCIAFSSTSPPASAASPRICRSFEVDQGFPTPPVPTGESTAKRWWCEGFDVEIDETKDYVKNEVPDSYQRFVGVNRVCANTDGEGPRDY